MTKKILVKLHLPPLETIWKIACRSIYTWNPCMPKDPCSKLVSCPMGDRAEWCTLGWQKWCQCDRKLWQSPSTAYDLSIKGTFVKCQWNMSWIHKWASIFHLHFPCFNSILGLTNKGIILFLELLYSNEWILLLLQSMSLNKVVPLNALSHRSN